MWIVRLATFPNDIALVLSIWREFVANSPVDLGYQNNEAEFATLPGKYAEPGGCVLLAVSGTDIGGCIAFRKVNHEICEMKRLYVRPHARGRNLGRALVERLIVEARQSGYGEMRLDVMAQFVAARRLYADFGFAPAAPISVNPTPGASFLGLSL